MNIQLSISLALVSQVVQSVVCLEQEIGLLIKVEDNGLGIPKNYKSDVFKMFTRFHPDVSFGSDLGMSIVKKYIGFLNGQINFESSTQGTIFTILLPKESTA